MSHFVSSRFCLSFVSFLQVPLKTQDPAVSRALNDGPAAADETRALLDRLQPSLPILMADLTSLDQVGITYRNDLEHGRTCCRRRRDTDPS